MWAKTGVHHYSGHNVELAQHVENTRVCTRAIADPADSGIIRRMPEQTGEK